MKKIRTALKIMAAVGLLAMVFQGCKDSSNGDNGPTSLDIESMTVGEADLNGAQSPSDVAVDASIEIEFNTEIQASSATAENITLTQDYDDTDIPLQISADGPILTITPEANLGGGILYEFQMSGLVNVDEQPIDQVTRTFTTAGTFSPSGMIANWTFEESAEDVVGDYDPSSDGVVDITYTASRNETAGMAATFNGNTSIIEIPEADPLVNTENFTISFWVKTNPEGHNNTDGSPMGHFVLGLGGSNGIQYEIFDGYSGGAKFAIQYELSDGTTVAEDMWFPSEAKDNSNGGHPGFTYAKSLAPSEMESYLKDSWLQVTYTFNGAEGEGHLYYNGELMKSIDFDEYPEDNSKRNAVAMKYGGAEPQVVNEFAFGFIHSREGTLFDDTSWGNYGSPDAKHFKGQLDDIKIYHKVLTETEIQLMYNSES